MAKAKPKIELKPEPDDDVRLYGVFDLWAAGFIPVGESRLRKLIQDREWECGTLGTAMSAQVHSTIGISCGRRADDQSART